MNKKWDEIEVINLRNEKFNVKVYEQMIEVSSFFLSGSLTQ